MGLGRATPLNRQAEDVMIDIGIWERSALADNNQIDPDEAMEGLPLFQELRALVQPMATTWGHVKACLDAERGMYSPKVIRRWNEAQGRPDNVIAFPVSRDVAAGD